MTLSGIFDPERARTTASPISKSDEYTLCDSQFSFIQYFLVFARIQFVRHFHSSRVFFTSPCRKAYNGYRSQSVTFT